jgi:hypothetical protein
MSTYLKIILLNVILVLSQESSCQQIISKFPLNGISIEEFIPEEYAISEKAEGDLDGDNLNDFCILIKKKIYSETENKNRKFFLIALYNPRHKIFNSVIFDENLTSELTKDSELDENEFWLSIKNKIINISFSNPRPGLDRNFSFYFKLFNNKFRLIKESFYFHFPGNNKDEQGSINFTKRDILEISNFYYSKMIVK